MARGKPVHLDTRHFPTKAEATSYFQAMLGRYSVGSKVTAADASDLTALLKHHSEYDDKVGAGISYFEVMQSPEFATHCFCIVRADGSKDDFSYLHCIRAKTQLNT